MFTDAKKVKIDCDIRNIVLKSKNISSIKTQIERYWADKIEEIYNHDGIHTLSYFRRICDNNETRSKTNPETVSSIISSATRMTEDPTNIELLLKELEKGGVFGFRESNTHSFLENLLISNEIGTASFILAVAADTAVVTEDSTGLPSTVDIALQCKPDMFKLFIGGANPQFYSKPDYAKKHCEAAKNLPTRDFIYTNIAQYKQLLKEMGTTYKKVEQPYEAQEIVDYFSNSNKNLTNKSDELENSPTMFK